MTDSLAFCEEIEEICASILAIIIGILAAIFASDIVYKILLLLIAATLFSLGSHRYFLDAKTLIISKSGIYTEFWLYKRFYKWSDFKYIGMRNCRRYYPRKNSDWKELIFYTKKAQNPVKSDDKSCASLHPFSLYISLFARMNSPKHIFTVAAELVIAHKKGRIGVDSFALNAS